MSTAINHENPQGATADLAAFTAGLSAEAVPARARELLTKLVLDWAGATIGGGAYAESSPALLRAVADRAGQGTGTVAGQPRHYPPSDAAFLNGTFAHSLEFDDTYIPGGLHPGAPTVAAALAAAEHQHSSGEELLTALAAGYEVACRVSAALGAGPFSRGFHPTGVAGIFGAVAAAAKLEGLDAQRVNSAFGIAGSLAAGSTQYLVSGSWNKRLHAGFAARNGLFAVQLAAAGVIGSVQAFEGEHGLVSAFTDTPDLGRLSTCLGERWDLLDIGIKPYPACRMAHGAIDAALALRDRLGPGMPAGAALTVTLNPVDDPIVGGTDANKIEPRNTVEAQFSVRFQVAVTLLRGLPDWSVYELVGDPAVTELCHRITTVTDPAVPNCGAVLTVSPADGEEVTVRVGQPRGEPGIDVPWELLERKFASLAGGTFTQAGTAAIITAARSLADGGSADRLAAALSAPHDTAADSHAAAAAGTAVAAAGTGAR